MPRLPSEVLRLREAGRSHEECLDFDLAFAWFDDWLEGKRNETVMQKPKEHDGKVPMPKYTSLAAILDEYDTSAVPGQIFEDVQAIRDDVDAALDDFLATMEPEF